MLDLSILCILTFAAFTVRVVTGFGSAILLSPILSNLLPPKQAVPLIILLETFVNLIFVIKERIRFSLKEVYIGGFIGIAAGLALFGSISQQVAGLIIGISMGILSILMLAGFRFRVRNERALFVSIGFISGSMGVLTGVNGPQIILGLTNQGYDAMFIRTFIITYLVVIDTAIFAAFLLAGYINTSTLSIFAVLAPFIVFAYIAGIRLVGRISGESLRKAILLVVFASSLVLIYRYGGGMSG